MAPLTVEGLRLRCARPWAGEREKTTQTQAFLPWASRTFCPGFPPTFPFTLSVSSPVLPHPPPEWLPSAFPPLLILTPKSGFLRPL